MVTLAWHATAPQTPLATRPFHTWDTPDGALWTGFHRTPEGYTLRFPELADFHISGNAARVAGVPCPGVSSATVEHIYVNQVLPLALSKRGEQVYHASAVAIAGKATVFVGRSGKGKSTLAASFAVAGHPLLTDDALVVRRSASGHEVLPGHPSLRLWRDSEDAVIPAEALRAPAVDYTPKSRILTGAHLPYCTRACPLHRVYFLGDGTAESTTIAPVKAAEAAVAWLENGFLLDIEEQPRIAEQFDRVAGLATANVHWRLDYPRAFTELPRVLDTLLAHHRDENLLP
jgi:energy-coupling factor transporter ATP-binding protein EcfA2